jgi:hypothetical protein
LAASRDAWNIHKGAWAKARHAKAAADHPTVDSRADGAFSLMTAALMGQCGDSAPLFVSEVQYR